MKKTFKKCTYIWWNRLIWNALSIKYVQCFILANNEITFLQFWNEKHNHHINKKRITGFREASNQSIYMFVVLIMCMKFIVKLSRLFLHLYHFHLRNCFHFSMKKIINKRYLSVTMMFIELFRIDYVCCCCCWSHSVLLLHVVAPNNLHAGSFF